MNPRTLRVTKQIPVGRKPWDVAFAFGDVWVDPFPGRTLWRLRP